MATAFTDVKPWPKSEPDPNPRAVMGGNAPPLDQQIVEMFSDKIDAKDGLRLRIAQIIERGADPKPCDSDDLAGRYGDFIKMVGNAEAFVDAARTEVKAPYLEATRALDANARAITDALAAAKAKVKSRLDEYAREQARKVAAERDRIAAEQAKLRAAAEADAAAERERLQAVENARAAAEKRDAAVVETPEVEIVAPAPAPEISAPVFRGDLGSRVGIKTVWKHEIENVRQIPDHILKSGTVVEAISKVVAAQVRSGIRAIRGVRIYSENQSSVR